MQNKNEQPSHDSGSEQLGLPDADRLSKLDRDPSFVDKVYPRPKEPVPYTPSGPPSQPSQSSVSAHAYIVEEKKPKKHWAIVIASVSVVVGGLFAVGIYYAAVRLSDTEYQKATAIIDSMANNAKSLADFGAKHSMDTIDEVDSRTLSTAMGNAQEYSASLKKLQQSPVLQRDGDVKVVYSVNQKRIEDYASSTMTMITTVDIYSNVVQKCIDFGNKMADIKTVDDFDLVSKECFDYAKNHPTVPTKDFNDGMYVKYRDLVLDFISAARSYYVAVAKNDKTVSDKALANVNDVGQQLTNVAKGKHYTIQNTLNPKDQLGAVRASVQQRKDVFFR